MTEGLLGTSFLHTATTSLIEEVDSKIQTFKVKLNSDDYNITLSIKQKGCWWYYAMAEK